MEHPFIQGKNVVSATPISFTNDGTPAVYQIVYPDGSTKIEAPTSMMGSGDLNWMANVGQGATPITTGANVGDNGEVGLQHLGYTLTDPSQVSWEQYTPEGLDSTASIMGILGAAGLGALGASGALGGLFGSGAAAGGGTAAMPIDEWGSLNDFGIGDGVSASDSLWQPGTTGSLSNAVSALKNILPSGTPMGDIISAAMQMVGQNAAKNSTNDLINNMFDRIQGANGFTPEQQKAIADAATNRLTTDYLTPEVFNALSTEYGDRGNQADALAGVLSQLYTDPTQLGVYNAINDLALENTMRTQGARGTLQSGSTSNDYANASIASMLQLANPMTQSLGTMYQGQTVPVKALEAVSGAQQANVQSGAAAGNVANAPMTALAGLGKEALGLQVLMDPTRANLSSLYAGMGNKAGGGSGNPFSRVADWGLSQIFKGS